MAARPEVPAVLIVDADPGICRIFAVKLSRDTPYLVVSATNEYDAYRAALERPFQGLLWDLALRDTYLFLPRLRALCPDAALLPLTTDDSPVIPVDVARLHVHAPLVKPVNLDTMVAQVRDSLEHRHLPLPPVHSDLSHVGQQVRIESAGGVCMTRVLETALDSFLVVGAPRVEEPADFGTLPGVLVQVQGQDALYRFRSRILYPQSDPVPCWALAMPRILRRLQRRQEPRFALRLPVALATAVQEPETATAVSAQTVDISSRGMAVVSNLPLEVGSVVTFRLVQERQPEIAGAGEVVSVAPLEPAPATGASYRVALRITTLEDAERVRLAALLQTAE